MFLLCAQKQGFPKLFSFLVDLPRLVQGRNTEFAGVEDGSGRLILFIVGVFNDAVSSSGCIASNDDSE
jgi:hypothetical protein